MDDPLAIRPEGVQTLSEHLQDAPVPEPLSISSRATLGDLSPAYAFYSPALLYTKLPLQGRDPYADFLAETGRAVMPYSLQFQHQIFHGLDSPWNHVLHVLEADTWKAYQSWLGSLAIHDRERGEMVRVRYRDVLVVDPLWAAHQSVWTDQPQTLLIAAVCLDGTRGCWWLQPEHGVMGPMPVLRYTREVFNETQAFAKAWVAETPQPYAAIECPRPELKRPDHWPKPT